MSLPKYGAYKPSGTNWLADVPAHWNTRRLGYFFEERREKVSDKDFPPLSVTKHGIVPQLETAAKTDDGDNRKKVVAGDFVINSRSDRKGSSGAATQDGSVSLINTVLRPVTGIDIRFAHHLLRSVPFQEEFYRYGKGIVADLWSTNYSEMRNIVLALPEVGEQAIIAAFLDRETEKIDTLIAEQEKLIVLLAEKRQATISHAVTKGLNPNAAIKDSGVAWLGAVPAHWSTGACKHWFLTSSGGTPDTGRQQDFYVDVGGYPWIRTTDLGNDRLTSYEIAITDAAIDSTACTLLPENSVLVAMYGGEGSIGKNALLTFEACINQAVCALLPSTLFDSRYVWRYVQFYRPYWMIGAESSRKDPNISQEVIRNAPMLMPPMEEQQEIADFLDAELTNIDKLGADAERAIKLLKERRSAIIAAAVTGLIDVRGTMPQVSDGGMEAIAA